MGFTGQENHAVTLTAGAALTADFRNEFPAQTQGVYFSKATLQNVLDQTGCVGIRFYFGMNRTGKFTLVFAGVDTNENDIIGIVGNNGAPCPPNCSQSNGLNS